MATPPAHSRIPVKRDGRAPPALKRATTPLQPTHDEYITPKTPHFISSPSSLARSPSPAKRLSPVRTSSPARSPSPNKSPSPTKNASPAPPMALRAGATPLVPRSRSTSPTKSPSPTKKSRSPDKPKRTLLSLPREIQARIFSFTYPAQVGGAYISRQQWESREFSRKYDWLDSAAQSFPYKVNDFLISKTYFTPAAKAYVENQTFGSNFIAILREVKGVEDSVLSKYAATVSVSAEQLPLVIRLPNLSELVLEVDESHFVVDEKDCVWKRAFTEQQLKGLELYANVMQCPVLKHVKTINTDIRSPKPPHKQKMWSTNIKAFEEMVNQALKAKTKHSSEDTTEGVSEVTQSNAAKHEPKTPVRFVATYAADASTPLETTSKGRDSMCEIAEGEPPTMLEAVNGTVHGVLNDLGTPRSPASERPKDLQVYRTSTPNASNESQDLHAYHVPDSLAELEEQFRTDGEGLMAWVHFAKEHTPNAEGSIGTPASKASVAEDTISTPTPVVRVYGSERALSAVKEDQQDKTSSPSTKASVTRVPASSDHSAQVDQLAVQDDMAHSLVGGGRSAGRKPIRQHGCTVTTPSALQDASTQEEGREPLEAEVWSRRPLPGGSYAGFTPTFTWEPNGEMEGTQVKIDKGEGVGARNVSKQVEGSEKDTLQARDYEKAIKGKTGISGRDTATEATSPYVELLQLVFGLGSLAALWWVVTAEG